MDITELQPRRRYLVVTENNEYWFDDYFIGPGGVTGFIKQNDKYIMINIYEPIITSVDFQSDYTPEKVREEIKRGQDRLNEILKHTGQSNNYV